MLLEPLDEEEAARLVDRLAVATEVTEGARLRVLEAAEGNPLFVEELMALLREDATPSVPPTIHAVLQARLDLLDHRARELVGLASIEGTVFHRTVVTALGAQAGAELDAELDRLVRRDLVRPAAPTLPGDEAFRFRHVLIRDAAYGSLSKERRAQLHARLATWLDEQPNVDERDELAGHHLEQAAVCRRQLGTADPELEQRAGERLAVAGMRSVARVDTPAALSLLTRALAQLPVTHPRRPEVALELGLSLELSGRVQEADERYAEAIQVAGRVGNEPVQIRAKLAQLHCGHLIRPGSTRYEDCLEEGQRAVASLEADDDPRGLAEAWTFLAGFHYWLGQFADAVVAFQHGIDYAGRAGNPRLAASAAAGMAASLLEGPTHVAEALERIDALDRPSDDPLTAMLLLATRGALVALSGALDEGYALMRESSEAANRLGAHLHEARLGSEFWYVVAAAAGRVQDAEHVLRGAVRFLDDHGERGLLSTRLVYLGHIAYAAGEFAAADVLAKRCAELSPEDDYANRVELRLLAAKLAAHAGEADTAQKLASDAVAIAERTDSHVQTARALEDCAAVEQRLGRPREATAALEQAIAMHKRKGCELALRRLRAATNRSLSTT
jgi:predicted ATPase